MIRRLPTGFVSDWSVHPEVAEWLFEHVVDGNYQTMVECGSGLSTIVIARGLQAKSRRDESKGGRLFSLEHDTRWIRNTDTVLRTLDLQQKVELIHSPIVARRVGGRSVNTYDLNGLPDRSVDLLFIDGPTPDVGRVDVVPAFVNRLSQDATVVLDDAGRLAERNCIREWTTRFGMIVEQLLVVGRGLAVMRFAGTH